MASVGTPPIYPRTEIEVLQNLVAGHTWHYHIWNGDRASVSDIQITVPFFAPHQHTHVYLNNTYTTFSSSSVMYQ